MTSLQAPTFNTLALLMDPQFPCQSCADLAPSPMRSAKSRFVKECTSIELDKITSFLNCRRYGFTDGSSFINYTCSIRNYCPPCGILYNESIGRDKAQLLKQVLEATRLQTNRYPSLTQAVFSLPVNLNEILFVDDCFEIAISKLMAILNKCVEEILLQLIPPNSIPKQAKVRFASMVIFQGWSKENFTEPYLHFHVLIPSTFLWQLEDDPIWRMDIIANLKELSEASHENLQLKWLSAVNSALQSLILSKPIETFQPEDMPKIHWQSMTWRGAQWVDKYDLTCLQNLRGLCRYTTRSPWKDIHPKDLKTLSSVEWKIIASHHSRPGFERIRQYGFLSKRSIGEFASVFALDKTSNQSRSKPLTNGRSFEIIYRDAKQIAIRLLNSNEIICLPRNQVKGERCGGRSSRIKRNIKHKNHRVPNLTQSEANPC